MSSGFGQQRSWHGCTPHHVSRTTSHHASAERDPFAACNQPPRFCKTCCLGGAQAMASWHSCGPHPLQPCRSYNRGVSTPGRALPLSRHLRALYPSILASSPRRMRPLSPTRAALLPPALAHACCTSTARAPLSLADAHATRLPRASPPFCGGRDPHIYAYGSQARTNAAHPYFQHFLDQLLRKPAHLRSHRG